MRRAAWYAAIILVLALPLLIPAMPPLVDLPAHMGRYHIAANLAHSESLQRYFSYHWSVMGNLGVDVLVAAIAPVLGIEAATRLVVMAIPVLMGLGMVLTAREVHGKLPVTAPAALVFAYAYPFHYGFVNYCLSVALMFLALALWLRLGRLGQDKRRAALFLLISPSIWLAHAVGWGMLLAACGAAELHRQYSVQPGKWLKWPAVFSGLAFAFAPLIMPVALLSGMQQDHGPAIISGWFNLKMIGKWALMLNRDRWIYYDLACTLSILALIGAALVRWRGLRFHPVLASSAAALFLLFLIAPDSINGSAFVNGRIAPYAAALAILAIDTNLVSLRLHRWLSLATMAFLIMRIAATTYSFALYDSDIQRHLRALDHTGQGSRIAIFATNPCQASLANWANPRIQHIAGYALTRHNAFVNDQFAGKDLQLLRVHYDQAAPFVSDDDGVVARKPCANHGLPELSSQLAKLPRQAFDYVWVIEMPTNERVQPSWLHPLYSDDTTALYSIKQQQIAK